MKFEAQLEWRKDCFGRQQHALFLGALYAGEIMQSTMKEHHLGEWRGWFMGDDSGYETGWFPTAEQARQSVETYLLKALDREKVT